MTFWKRNNELNFIYGRKSWKVMKILGKIEAGAIFRSIITIIKRIDDILDTIIAPKVLSCHSYAF